MGEKKFEAEEYVYREGDVADNAYAVLTGKVELLEQRDNKEVAAGLIEPGQVFGELAVFMPASMRSHSAKVLEAATVNVMTLEEFQTHVAACPAPIQPFLKRAWERMKSTRVKVKPSITSTVLETDIAKITLAPDSDKLKSQIKPIEIPIARLPFRIGGYPESGEASRRDAVHLSIASQDAPLRVSRQHCEISIENKGIVVTDLGSRFNTRVNGLIIGRGRGNYMAPLKKGANEVILGAADGPYRFILTCA